MHIHMKQHLKGVEHALEAAGKDAFEQAKPQLKQILEDEMKKLTGSADSALIEAAVGAVDPGQVAGQVIDSIIAGIRQALGLPAA